MFQKGDLKVEQEQRCGIHDATEDYVLNLQKWLKEHGLFGQQRAAESKLSLFSINTVVG